VKTPILDPDSVEGHAIVLLRSIGLKATRPRIAVVSQVLQAGDTYVRRDTLAETTAAGDTWAHRATVYRTLDGLAAAGVLCHVQLDHGITAYHLASAGPTVDRDLHLHAQCTCCGQIAELPASVLGNSGTRIRTALGFYLDARHIALPGLCQDCVANTRSVCTPAC
jgi:Fur family ferric uptake transcriptional regulator